MKVFTIICILLSISSLYGNELIDGLKNQINAVINQMPANYQSLVGNLRGSARADASYFQPSQFNSEMQRFGFSQDIVIRFQNIIWSQSVAFQTFTTSFINNHFLHDEFIGIGRNNNGLISIAFVQGSAQGDSQKDIDRGMRIKNCNMCMGIPQPSSFGCFNHFRCQFIKQDLTITNEDLINVDAALRAYSLQLALQKLNTMNGMENSLENFSRYAEEQQKHDEEQRNFMNQLLEYKENCQNYVKQCPDQIQEQCVFLECLKQNMNLTEQVLCKYKVEQCKNILIDTSKLEKHCNQCICLQNKIITKGSIFECL